MSRHRRVVETDRVSAPGPRPDSAVAAIVARGLALSSASVEYVSCPGPTYVALRRAGRLLFASWQEEESLLDAIAAAGAQARDADRLQGVDTVELCMTHGYVAIPAQSWSPVFANVHRGVCGIEFEYRGRVERYAPTRMIASNLKFTSAFRRFLASIGITEGKFLSDGGVVRRFDARQILVSLKPTSTACTMHRGNRVIDPETVSVDTIPDMVTKMGDWLLRQVADDGRLIYKYWPSRGETSPANNTIRQFMATICLLRLARFTGETAARNIALRNLDYNLAQFFWVHDGLGVIEHDGKAKLGAAALAALAILERPVTEKYRPVLELLCSGIDALWRTDGSFRTFHKPIDRNDNQNFYPGEALLFWASFYAVEKDEALLARCVLSFEYYREWHRRNRNPAFIPWHSQAYALLYQHTRQPELKDFVFEMNDWLLPMQQWDDARYPDLKGRFYDPRHPEYGPPHASSTGVYLEGLADAYRLAIETGDVARANRYRRVIWRGLRSIRQLQLLDDVDMFYISKRDRVRGGVRTEVYDNTIRVDNVQHCLMALLKLSQMRVFMEQDFSLTSPAESMPC